MAVAFATSARWSRHPFGVTVGLLRFTPGAVVDGYGEPDSWSSPIPFAGCVVAPGAVVEPFEANREGSGVEFTVYFPPGTTVSARDRVQLPGHSEPFDVLGAGRDWGRSPFSGRPSGVVVEVGRFDG